MDWSNWNGSTYTGEEPKITYDQMKSIEELTNYEFTTGQKATALADGVKDEAVKTAQNIDNTVTNVTDQVTSAVKNTWSIAKYYPILLMLAGLFVVLSYSKGLKWEK